ncbi:hypothetical protein B7494_g2882 [Chlorociboria aeruginascens]|nr:hypothetical protein B7494_g2882 [Chlorociboria aeruginascens]
MASPISPILYQNTPASTRSCGIPPSVILLDIPHSISQAQGQPYPQPISCAPLQSPYPPTEPKSAKAALALGPDPLQDVFRQRYLQFVLEEVRAAYEGPWCLERITGRDAVMEEEIVKMKNRKLDSVEDISSDEVRKEVKEVHVPIFHQNTTSHTTYFDSGIRIPTKSAFLRGDIESTSHIFMSRAPEFNLIVLDPPWPNRSARRKKDYSISYNASSIRCLLSSLPISSHLALGGYIGIWVTNKPAFQEMVLGEGGVFEEWGVELVEEWLWLKVTEKGEPICALDSRWRKPWEVLFVAKRKCQRKEQVEGVKRRVIIGVPDLHTRKPSLRRVFEALMGEREDGYEALEVFARNLTSGWWAWGNEVLKFQGRESWFSE